MEGAGTVASIFVFAVNKIYDRGRKHRVGTPVRHSSESSKTLVIMSYTRVSYLFSSLFRVKISRLQPPLFLCVVVMFVCKIILTLFGHTALSFRFSLSHQARSRVNSFFQSRAQDAAEFSTENIVDAESTLFAPVVTVDSLDVDRFTGRWFQV